MKKASAQNNVFCSKSKRRKLLTYKTNCISETKSYFAPSSFQKNKFSSNKLGRKKNWKT